MCTNSTAWTDYYFAKNLQGDVLEVYQARTHTLVAEYMYDAWGNVLWKSGSLSDLNPFRYRGYYYDTETWFYYLQSRYYDPAIGRFINADSLVSTGQGIIGNNMFAYCGNNPVNYSDPSGTRRKFWYALFEAHDPGYIHRAVQAHILIVNNIEAEIFEQEHYMPGIGRADIICSETNEMWEIKHAGSTDAMRSERTENAINQLNRYIKKGATLQPGKAGAFTGSFVINYNNTSYLISYDTPASGVVLYSVSRLSNVETSPFRVYAPAPALTNPSTSKQMNPAMFLLLFAFPSGGDVPIAEKCY